MNKNWKPLLDRLLVKQDPAPHLFPTSGLAIPESQREDFRPFTGLVVAVGPGTYQNGVLCPVNLKEGEHVMFANPDTLTKVEHAGAEHLMMMERDVFLVLDKPSAVPYNAETDRHLRAAQVCIKRFYYVTDTARNVAELDGSAPGTTHTPLLNDRFRTYNGIVVRAIKINSEVSNIDYPTSMEVVPEKDGFTWELRHALKNHAEQNIPLAYLGPEIR